MFDQSIETWTRPHVSPFELFGGAPIRIVLGNVPLLRWCLEVACRRVHGTTRQVPLDVSEGVAQALAREACRRGHEVRVIAAARMLQHLAGGRAGGSCAQRLRRYVRPDFLVLYDFGLVPVQSP